MEIPEEPELRLPGQDPLLRRARALLVILAGVAYMLATNVYLGRTPRATASSSPAARSSS